ncbi:MAG: thioredoxin domain-containing protein [Dehalococcoidales bacterium]|nr:thioredoxin domain-containing protein [Dehalococcoidales bacterium]
MSNRLIEETSPYLLQHAENPVDWYPWSEMALTKARTEDKPILLSIGYSACHWCHVMAHESFENADIARLMNDNFVNIKVDREERPDLDEVYMKAVQSITGRGGWPLTVFLTPDGKPFYGGTYFPPEDRQGMPGFPHVLQTVADAYYHRRREVEQATGEIFKTLKSKTPISSAEAPLSVETLSNVYSALKPNFDWEYGGFGGAPKFPQPMAMEFLLRNFLRTRNPEAIKMVTLTLEKMAAGGIYDQIGGGFHRYATDNIWLVPHFEKMLYDNALLSRVYLQAFLVTGKQLFRRIAEETLDFILRDMTGSEGGFYSTFDADSEGVEGKYYVWTPLEVAQVLGEKTGSIVNNYFGVTAGGNFEGNNILHVAGEIPDQLPELLQEARTAMLNRRRQRVPPRRDEKVIASWNGLMLSSLAEAACIFGREDYRAAAAANGSFLINSMMDDAYLKHTWKDGKAKVEGFLDDYAMVIEGLLNLHMATFSGAWLRRAIGIAEVMVDEFWDKSAGMWYDTSKRHQSLFIRPSSTNDNAVPSGASSATMACLKIARLTGKADLERIAVQALRRIQESAIRYPLGFCNWLCALDFQVSSSQEIVIIGNRQNDSTTQELLRILYSRWFPNKVVVLFDPSDPALVTGLPLLEGKIMIDGRPTIYLCENYSCSTPITDQDLLRTRLSKM